MKNRIFSLLLALTLCLGLAAPAAAAADLSPAPGTMTYTQVISPQYEDAGLFGDGLAPVKQNGKWGYINAENEVVVPFQYDLAGTFSEGYAVVGVLTNTQAYSAGLYNANGYTEYLYELGFVDENGAFRWFLDESGNRVTYVCTVEAGSDDEPELTPYHHFYNGTIPLINNWNVTYPLYGTDGRPVSDVQSYGWHPTEGILVTGHMGYGDAGDQHFYNMTTGQEFWVDTSSVPGDWYQAELRPFNQGLAPASLYDYEYNESLWGFVDTAGKFVIAPAYQNFRVMDFYDVYEVFGEGGLAIVQDRSGLWGAVDKGGQPVIPFQFDYLYSFTGGLAAYEDNGQWGFINLESDVVIPAQYDRTSGFSDLGVAVVVEGGNAYLIDRHGDKVPGSEQLDADTYVTAGNETVWTPGEYVVIEENGKYGFGHIEYAPPLPDTGDLDSWAYGLVAEAIQAGLIPTELQNLYRENITRGEFCVLLVQVLETVTGQEMEDLVSRETGKSLTDWQQSYPFHDSTSQSVIACNALGIISGRGAGVFGPYDLITRQEAAAMLTQTARVLDVDTAGAPAAGYADQDTVASYFQDAVNFVTESGIMGGTGGSAFSPLSAYSREQSYITVYRLYQLTAGETQQPDPEPQPEPEPEPMPEPEPEPVQPEEPVEEEPVEEPETSAAPTPEEVYNAIMALKSQYPEGMRWTNDNYYHSNAVRMTGAGCAGFALICSDAAFGDLPVTGRHSDFDRIQVGDMLRINHDTHSVVVLEKLDDSVIVTEGNYNSSIHWGREISRASLESGDYVVTTRYPK